MRIVIIKHIGNLGNYMFSVPQNQTLKEGDLVLVKNRRGNVSGVCVCDSFDVPESPLKTLMAKYGAKEPLASVVGKYSLEQWSVEDTNG